MKLSPKQLDVLVLMNSDWELGQSVAGMSTRYWLQKGGIGRGGETKEVHFKVAQSLMDKGMLMQHYGFPTTKYSLTNAAKMELVR